MVFCFFWMGDPDRAQASCERALAIASALGDFGVRVSANFRLGITYVCAGKFRRAAEVFRWNVESLEGKLAHERFGLPLIPYTASRGYLGWCLAALGDFASASATAEEGVRVAEAAHHHYSLGIAYWLAGRSPLLQGNFQKAISWLERGLDLGRRDDIPHLVSLVGWFLGEAYARSGRVAEGVALLEQAAGQFAAMKMMGWYPGTVTSLSAAYVLAGRLADAGQSIERALELSRVHKQRAVEADALRVVGDIHAGQVPPDVEAADAAYREAMTLADELGMRPLVAHCHLGLAKLYRRSGQDERAREHLRTATTQYREMDMRFWLAQAEAEMRKVG
jgi:tetratricopeptide (TPR) repeat protein